MIRTFALIGLAVLLAGCTRFQTREGNPFNKQKKEPPPPYGSLAPSAPKPVGGQSPLGMASADPAPPLPPDEQKLIPPRPNAAAPAPAAAAPPQVAADPGVKNLADLKSLVATSRSTWNNVSTYEAVITRRELNPKGQINNEMVLFQFRREPMSVFTRNVGESGKGREVVYNPGAHGDKLHVMLGAGDNKLLPAGTLAPAPISPDDPRVKEKARYSIRDAGFARWIAALSAAVTKVEVGQSPPDSLTYRGEMKRDEYAHPLVGVTHKLRPGDDPLIPGGGVRHYFFDMRTGSPSYGLPVVITASDAAGKEVEYYLTDKMKNPAGLTDANFNPARLGK